MGGLRQDFALRPRFWPEIVAFYTDSQGVNLCCKPSTRK
jgi:hypothetical protein